MCVNHHVHFFLLLYKMFFIRFDFQKFRLILQDLCAKNEYLWTDEEVYRFMQYVELTLQTKLASDVCVRFSDLVVSCFADYIRDR